ncbi:hypothetical protein DL96DRAFT_1553346 [Flagelloscypha sp. PMI_526]|nr:hypothetical protein DL96DRAFT_1553346 [Flagelloscypha sp. PMI_526]
MLGCAEILPRSNHGKVPANDTPSLTRGQNIPRIPHVPNDTVPSPFQVDANVKFQDAFDTRIDLKNEPRVVNKLTLYRTIANPEEIHSTKDHIGTFPDYISYSEGDVRAPATENLYFFDVRHPFQHY